jgi:hypothetical protein
MKRILFVVLVFAAVAALLWASGIAPGAYNLLQNAGVALTARSVLNFVNGGCTDNSGSSRTDCTIGGTLYSQTNSVTDNVQTTETSLVGTGSGTNVLTPNFYAIGTALKVSASGFYSTTVAPGTITVRLKHSGGATGTVTLASTGAVTPTASVTNGAWRLIATVTCRTTGAGGTLIVNTIFETTGTVLTPGDPAMVNTTTVTVDTTAAQTADLTVVWSAAGQSITATNLDLALPGGGSASNGVTFTIANAGATGTTTNTLTKLTGAPSTAVITATTDTGGAVGITTSGAGTTGTAVITISGQANCVFDAGTTAGHYVQLSSTTAGNCHDTGAATYPTSGQVVGRVLSTNGGAGTYSTYLFPSEIKGASGGGGFIQTLNAPASGSFTARNFNVGTNVVTTQVNNSSPVTSITLLQHDPNGTNNMAALSKNVIAATFTVSIAISMGLCGTNNNCQTGLWLSDGGGGPNNLMFGFTNGFGIAITVFSNFTTNSSVVQRFSTQFPGGIPLLWLRIQETASNRIYSTSSDGVTWAQFFSEGNTAHFTTAQYGFVVQNLTASAAAPDFVATWYSFSESNP